MLLLYANPTNLHIEQVSRSERCKCHGFAHDKCTYHFKSSPNRLSGCSDPPCSPPAFALSASASNRLRFPQPVVAKPVLARIVLSRRCSHRQGASRKTACLISQTLAPLSLHLNASTLISTDAPIPFWRAGKKACSLYRCDLLQQFRLYSRESRCRDGLPVGGIEQLVKLLSKLGLKLSGR